MNVALKKKLVSLKTGFCLNLKISLSRVLFSYFVLQTLGPRANALHIVSGFYVREMNKERFCFCLNPAYIKGARCDDPDIKKSEYRPVNGSPSLPWNLYLENLFNG